MLSSSVSRSLPRFCARTLWSGVPLAPPDAILGLTVAHNNDPDPRKINLGAGTFRGEDGKPYVLECVRAARRAVLDADMDHEYAPISGIASYAGKAGALAFGSDKDLAGRTVSSQTISGTGAVRVLAEFLARFADVKTVLVPDPTWGNHAAILKDAGVTVAKYRYWDAGSNGLDFAGMVEDIRAAPKGTPVLLHACAHNPTGVDPTPEQWAEVSAVCKEREHVVFFDMAYQGFASGSPDKDSAAVRKFVEDGHDVLLAQSFAKNFGLYGERAGALHVVARDADTAKAVDSQIKLIARAMYSSPPINGARIVDTVLSDPKLVEIWYKDLELMSSRMLRARQQLKAELEAAGSVRDWSHATDQTGMFFYSGLSKDQVATLIKDKHIYLTADGRISVSGINPGNVQYLAQSIHEVTK